MTLAAALSQLIDMQLRPEHMSTRLDLSVRIISVPERSNRRTAFLAEVLSCESCENPFKPRIIKLSWYQRLADLNAGDRWQLSVRLKPPSTLRNPGGFDAVAWNLARGVHARGYVLDTETARLLPEDEYLSLSAARQSAARRLQRLSENDEILGLLQALTVGVKFNITDSQWDTLRNTGTAHLMAISGLHIGLVAAWALFLGRCLGRLVNRFCWRMSCWSLFDTYPQYSQCTGVCRFSRF